MNKQFIGQNLMLNNVRLDYVHLVEPFSYQGNEPRYTTRVLLDKDHLEELEVVINDIVLKQWKKIKPSTILIPIHDGNTTDRQEYVGKKYMNVSSKNKPLIVDNLNNQYDGEEISNFSICNIFLYVRTYEVAGRKGISIVLDGCQIVKMHERFNPKSSFSQRNPFKSLITSNQKDDNYNDKEDNNKIVLF